MNVSKIAEREYESCSDTDYIIISEAEDMHKAETSKKMGNKRRKNKYRQRHRTRIINKSGRFFESKKSSKESKEEQQLSKSTMIVMTPERRETLQKNLRAIIKRLEEKRKPKKKIFYEAVAQSIDSNEELPAKPRMIFKNLRLRQKAVEQSPIEVPKETAPKEKFSQYISFFSRTLEKKTNCLIPINKAIKPKQKRKKLYWLDRKLANDFQPNSTRHQPPPKREKERLLSKKKTEKKQFNKKQIFPDPLLDFFTLERKFDTSDSFNFPMLFNIRERFPTINLSESSDSEDERIKSEVPILESANEDTKITQKEDLDDECFKIIPSKLQEVNNEVIEDMALKPEDKQNIEGRKTDELKELNKKGDSLEQVIDNKKHILQIKENIRKSELQVESGKVELNQDNIDTRKLKEVSGYEIHLNKSEQKKQYDSTTSISDEDIDEGLDLLDDSADEIDKDDVTIKSNESEDDGLVLDIKEYFPNETKKKELGVRDVKEEIGNYN